MKEQVEKAKIPVQEITHKPLHAQKLPWETPKMEDVSEEVMAQPYIRFT